MAATICPTVTVENEREFNSQINILSNFSSRIHIDLSDGKFSPNKLIDIDKVWWPGNLTADLHVMYDRPFDHINELMALGPELIIVHAEAKGDIAGYAEKLHRHGIELGVALLKDTSVEAIQPHLSHIDHVLIFAGHLGYYGGEADLNLLEKVKAIKFIKPNLEVGWDGGVNDQNIIKLVEGGVDVLNVGGFIANSDDPRGSYAKLKTLTGS
jgi:ribulose-phosphate 3-epimerase